MGPPPPPPFSSSLLLLLLFILISLTLSHYPFFNNNTIIVAYAESNTPPPTPTPTPTPIPKDITDIPHQSTFKPGVAIVAGALTLIFSLTFLLLLFIKHCSGNETSTNTSTSINLFSNSAAPSLPSSITARKNSGIDRTVVDSLPIFRFGSLRGQKDGLDCAVCLSKFESAEVLRLLPKCKHAFHVECVDTWLDAHSTCPLCRYRVDPEDILLVMEDAKKSSTNKGKEEECLDIIEKGTVAVADSKRRHSSVGESEWEGKRKTTSSFRWSLDSKKKEGVGIVGIGCFVRPRKDGLLLTKEEKEKEKERKGSVERRRLEHRIIVSPSPTGVHQRWSDVQPCDLLYLTSEMIISEARRLQQQKQRSSSSSSTSRNNDYYHNSSSRGIINSRSVSEITGFSRFPSNRNRNNNNNNDGLISRWLAWISQSHS